MNSDRSLGCSVSSNQTNSNQMNRISGVCQHLETVCAAIHEIQGKANLSLSDVVGVFTEKIQDN